ncbi:MAG: hypothetical protein KJO40_07245 [Deltaproteobacteria bacterium]|nr:hypothetical protein [Deltaproteobacteria bacterium]NND28294.1 hypothetical protein [Myxococcales bacterium]MBT8466928.1 hypothetical protein [Deltaproteobacteria bacterium]MBT8482453.1 hypothetical protein [Deltaproteobacteria bacterium]NNK07080.1 hypothetical protein [Myxococcales bacterium]
MGSRFRIREDRRGGWNVIVNTIAMNGAQACRSVDELDELICTLHLEGLLEVADVASLRQQLEQLEAALRVSKQRQALFHLGRQEHAYTRE